ncbi:ThuA domain-containing protein [uncultured Draconibacterium sp.]|uniref:ThuA domain-containing protein n=1 Tax=uncultured Draconibacterium sp. TaxID=1573823 RepID=UPI0029C96B33|nr:ThuA domain-containing protein [uncultured Draconibacterium sp.]
MLRKSRRDFIKASALTGAGLLFLTPKSYAWEKMQNDNTLKGKKVLYVYGGWSGHEPKQSVDVFVPWLKSEGAELTVSDSLDSYLDEELMGSVDLIVQAWTMGTITNEQEKGLLKAIGNGAGLAGWHGGIGDSFRNNTEYQFMVGGQWVAHPGGVIDYSVQITDKNDPVTKGLSDFRMHSEQYYMHIDPNVKVLATTEFTAEHSSWIEECVMPVVWKKYYGSGRVFYSSLGHVMTDFEVPEALEIMKRGIRWAAESKYAPKEKWVSPVYK